jgi:uncharacterized protein (UPF0261 family)
LVDALLTPNAVVIQLAELSRDLDHTVRLLKDADLDAVSKRHIADLAESHSFVQAEGSMDLRKHLARIATDRQEQEAVVAEAVVRYLRQRLNAIGVRIDVGRSVGAALRAELAALPYDPNA